MTDNFQLKMKKTININQEVIMKCRICGNVESNTEYEVFEMFFGYKDVFHYFQCSECDCLQIRDFPENISKYYPSNYYSLKSIPDENFSKLFLRNLRTNYAVFNKGLLGKYLYSIHPTTDLRILHNIKITRAISILDVGCGRGVLLFSLKALGFTNLLGIDPYIAKDFKYQNGLEILKKTIHNINDKWDIIMFLHSFEHMSDPKETLHSVSQCLKSDGHCIIRIPVVPSYAWKKYGVNWVQLDAPRHFFIHSLKSMEILASNAGLKIDKVEFVSDAFQFWGSELYLKGIPLMDKCSYAVDKKKSIFSQKDISSFARHALELNKLNKGDEAIFFLKHVS